MNFFNKYSIYTIFRDPKLNVGKVCIQLVLTLWSQRTRVRVLIPSKLFQLPALGESFINSFVFEAETAGQRCSMVQEVSVLNSVLFKDQLYTHTHTHKYILVEKEKRI